MIIDQRRNAAGDHSDPEPNRVPPEEIINVVMTVPGEGAGTEKNDDADGQQPEEGEKENVGALTVHRGISRFSLGGFRLATLTG